MLIIQRDPAIPGFALNASTDMSDYFLKLAQDHGMTLEETVSRALLPSICEALRAETRDKAHLEVLIEQKADGYVSNP